MAKKRKVADSAPSKQLAKAKRAKKMPYVATQGVILRWHNMLEVTRGQSGLKAFQISEQERERAFDDDAAEDETLLPMCVGVFDEVQKQWTALSYCQDALHLAMEGFPDQFHVRSNGTWRALAATSSSLSIAISSQVF